MSEYTDTINDLQGMLNSLRIENAVMNLSRLSSGLFTSIYDVTIDNMRDFNLRNYQYMLHHMARNLIEKNTTLTSVSYGMNVYENGDSDNLATPAQAPRYTDGNNYMEFVKGEKAASGRGELNTRGNAPDSILYQTTNKFFDITDSFQDNENTGSGEIKETGDAWTDANSILFKTKQLWRKNKIKSIISEFHTTDVNYDGQARTVFGESHGRNLLTKQAEDNPNGFYDVNGYNNPYCRVWTHHHRYSQFRDGMRANSEDLAYWGSNFEWTKSEKDNDETRDAEYVDGENYDYAWRGRHNQDRKRANTVLDYKTGLVNIAPKYLGGQGSNIHPKSCMFSIENLAWRDYDPYSFEQALSWEQRGPLGGRIMWFPPYGITINETTNTNWNANEFIGRGEKVYTYVNTERTGNLSFIMLTDHPSSIDYASWYEGASDLNSHNDYLRYFAGCNDGKTEDNEFITGGNSGSDKGTSNAGMNNDMLIKRPPELTDEYPHEETTTFIIPQVKKEEPEPVIPPEPEPTDETVEFFIFFPNNYSGWYDMPSASGSDATVNAIAYLLAGVGAQREFSGNSSKGGIKYTKDIPITPENFSVEKAIGYEMKPNIPVTPGNSDTTGNYIVGSSSTKTYAPSTIRYWKYRIDAKQDGIDKFSVDEDAYKNCIIQSLFDQNGKSGTPKNMNYSDNKSFSFNLIANDDVKEMAEDKTVVYSFAEVAAAFYSEKVNNVPAMYNYLNGINDLNKDNVNKLIELFSDDSRELTSLRIEGLSNSHGYNNNKAVNVARNNALATNRARTAAKWLNSYSKWGSIVPESKVTPGKDVGEKEKYNSSGKNSKLYRSSHIVMTFSSNKTKSANKTDEPNIHSKFRHVELLEGGIVPDFTYFTAVYEFTGGDNYKPLSERPANWATNCTSYYINSSRDLETVDIHVDRIDEEEPQKNSTFKEYVGFRHVKEEFRDNGEIWNYYEKDSKKLYYEQVVPNENSEDGYEPVDKEDGATVTESQIIQLFNKFRDGNQPYGNHFENASLTVEQDEKYRGDYQEFGVGYNKDGEFHVYKIDDIIKQENEYYKSKINFGQVYEDRWWNSDQWRILNEEDFTRMGMNYLGILNTDPNVRFEPNKFIEYGDLISYGDLEHLVMCTFNMEDDFVMLDNSGITSLNLIGDYEKEEVVLIASDSMDGLYKLNVAYHGDEFFKEIDYDIVENVTADNFNDGEYYTQTFSETGAVKFVLATVYTPNTRYFVHSSSTHEDDLYSYFVEGCNEGDIVHYNNKVYFAWEEINFNTYFSENEVKDYNPSVNYNKGDVVKRYTINGPENNVYWVANKQIIPNDGSHFSDIISFDSLVYNEDGSSPDFMGGYEYSENDICRKNTDSGYYYYTPLFDPEEGEVYEFPMPQIPFNDQGGANWEKLPSTSTHLTTISWIATKLLDKGSEVLGYSDDELLKNKIYEDPEADVEYIEPDTSFDAIWKYGEFENYYGKDQQTDKQRLTKDVNLGDLAVNTIINDAPPAIFTDTEIRYLEKLLTDKWDFEHEELTEISNCFKFYISAYRLLDYIRYVEFDSGEIRDVLNGTSNTYEDMSLKSEHNDVGECDSTLWIDRGDGILIQECYLQNQALGLNYGNERSKELNKLRYDQEYHFYKQYMAEHPLVFEKLQEKIQYFEPAFHSMTPEGFNARLTFLQQCSRQGNAKTMSDEGGKTANNLAFGRPPFCVLRLGDFYNQMIVIDSISYDFGISDGLQWDLNPEGNGVQPMLAKINISFKFIGGGDITGPVRRLQNAMSFNYYANASFYDNRADRIEYQDTNYKTMGGNGNNKIDYDKSYVYKAALDSDAQKNIILRAK